MGILVNILSIPKYKEKIKDNRYNLIVILKNIFRNHY